MLAGIAQRTYTAQCSSFAPPQKTQKQAPHYKKKTAVPSNVSTFFSPTCLAHLQSGLDPAPVLATLLAMALRTAARQVSIEFHAQPYNVTLVA